MDLFTYHTLMMGNTKLQRHQRVLNLYEEAVDSTAKLDGGIYSLAMLAALNQGLYIQVPRIATTARDAKVQLTEAAYTILIQAYAELGSPELSLSCLITMREEGLVANVITYSAIIAACKDKPSVVLSLLDRMKAEQIAFNTVVLSTAINSLARGGGSYTDKAYEMLLDMEENGPEPNIYTYNNIVRVFAEVGKLDEALSILKNIKKHKLVPDRYTFTTLLMACGRANHDVDTRAESVQQIMDLMRDCGVLPDAIAYGAAMDAYRRAGNSLLAVKCLHDMNKNKIEPTAAHYNLVIRTLRAQGYLDKMFKMVMAISLKENAKINSNTFELVIESLLEVAKWKEALLLIGAMDKLSFKPSLPLCVELLSQLEKARQYKAAFAMYRYMVKSGFDFYENTLLNDVFKRLVSVAAKGLDADLMNSVPLNELIDNYSSTVKAIAEEAEAKVKAKEKVEEGKGTGDYRLETYDSTVGGIEFAEFVQG